MKKYARELDALLFYLFDHYGYAIDSNTLFYHCNIAPDPKFRQSLIDTLVKEQFIRKKNHLGGGFSATILDNGVAFVNRGGYSVEQPDATVTNKPAHPTLLWTAIVSGSLVIGWLAWQNYRSQQQLQAKDKQIRQLQHQNDSLTKEVLRRTLVWK